MSWWSEILGTAGTAYGNKVKADATVDAAAAAERERQKALGDTKQSVWLWIGLAGAISIILVTIFYATKR